MVDPQEHTACEALKDEMDTEITDWDGDCLIENLRPLKEDSSVLNDRRAAVLHLDVDPEERTGGNSLTDELDAELKDLAGDCIKVMRLLKDDSSLLKDRALAVLHLGVSRGCIEIVEQVVKFYTREDILGDKSEMDKQGVKSSADEGINASSGNEDASTVAPDEVRTKADNKSESSGADPSHSQDDAIHIAPDKGTSSYLLSLTNDLASLDSKADEIHARPLLDFDKLLRAPYLYSGPNRELDARAVALVNGNLDVLALLLTKTPSASGIDLHRDQLRKITEEVVERIKGDSRSLRVCQSIFDAWRNDREFNFLFWDFDLWEERVSEYLFHFLFTIRRQGNLPSEEAELILKCLWQQVWEHQTPPGEDPLWQSLLKLHDAQGRTPLHVAVDKRSVYAFRKLYRDFPLSDKLRVVEFAMKLPDGLGRTGWHRGIVLGERSLYEGVSRMHGELARQCRIMKIDHPGFFDVKADTYAYGTLWQQPMEDPVRCLQRRGIHVDLNSNAVSEENGFSWRGGINWITPLHSAIMHENAYVFYGSETFSPQDKPGIFRGSELDTLELATLRGHVETVKLLLDSAEQGLRKRGQNSEGGRNSKYGWLGLWKRLHYPGGGKNLQYGWLAGERPVDSYKDPTIHVAANSGNYELLKVFLEHKICDPYIEDYYKDPYIEDYYKGTVLHAVLDPKDFRIKSHLLDFVNVKYTGPIYVGPPAHESTIVERQGCINLLLQCGCDIFKVDRAGRAPYPKGSLSTDENFLSWWYDRQLKEFTASQNAMSFATNAISVMATLVATASYVGPLQPPLGYSSGDGPNQIQARYIWVRIFIVCDTLSFYLAIAAITFSLIPALPMPQQPMAAELKKTRGMIILAVATLFPSIVCILLAFAAGSIVVISANGISSLGGDLTTITASIGGAICLIGFLLLSIRLLGIIFPRSRWVRKIYDLTSVFLLGD